MRDHIDAIVSLGSGLTFTLTDTAAPDPLPQLYAFVTAPNLMELAESLHTAVKDVDDYIHITCTGSSPRQVRAMQGAVDVIFDGATPTVTGYITHLEKFTSAPITQDEQVTFEDTNTHPFYGVTTYRYQATPEADTDESS